MSESRTYLAAKVRVPDWKQITRDCNSLNRFFCNGRSSTLSDEVGEGESDNGFLDKLLESGLSIKEFKILVVHQMPFKYIQIKKYLDKYEKLKGNPDLAVTSIFQTGNSYIGKTEIGKLTGSVYTQNNRHQTDPVLNVSDFAISDLDIITKIIRDSGNTFNNNSGSIRICSKNGKKNLDDKVGDYISLFSELKKINPKIKSGLDLGVFTKSNATTVVIDRKLFDKFIAITREIEFSFYCS